MPLMPFNPKALIATLLAVAALAGCAATQQPGREARSQGGVSQEEQRAHHPQDAAAQPPATTGAGTAARQGAMMGGQGGMMGGQGGMMGGQMELKSMCDMHERMKRSRTPQERSAMMEDTMKNMTPEMRQRHVEMMERQCR